MTGGLVEVSMFPELAVGRPFAEAPDRQEWLDWRREGIGASDVAAIGLGRDAIGIDIDERNADLARERCGMFLEVAS